MILLAIFWMMSKQVTLYHGSNESFTTIDLTKSSAAKEFGRGFYLTDSRESAEKAALERVARGGGVAHVFAFEFDESALDKLKSRKFYRPCGDWALFVSANRKLDTSVPDHNCDCRYDIVIGPIVDDRIFLQFRRFERGISTIDEFVRVLSDGESHTQYSFHTESALRALKYLETYNVN